MGALACALVLAGCGGGGGGSRSGSGSGQGGGPITPAASVTVAVTSPAINATISQGDAYKATVSGTWSASNLGNGAVYLQVTDNAGTFTSPAIQAASGSTFSFSLTTATSIATGERNGTLTVRACKDSSCNSTHGGTSGSVTYRLTVNAVPDWETHQGNAAHNGYVPIQLDAGKFAKAWEWAAPRLDGATAVYVRRPVTGSNAVFAVGENQFADGSLQAGVVALDEGTGNVRWLATLTPSPADQFTTDAAVSGGKVYFGIANAEYTWAALDASTGSTLFTAKTTAIFRSSVAPVPYGGSIFVQEGIRNLASGLLSMNGSTGGVQWAHSIAQGIEGKPFFAPTVDAQHVYYHSACCLEVLDRHSGAVVASILNPNADAASVESRYTPTVIGSRGNVLAIAYTPAPIKRLLSSFNIANKAREWTAAKSYLSSVAVASGVIYAVYVENSLLKLDALDEATGQVLWTWSQSGADVPAVATSGGNIIVTRNLVFFNAFDSATRRGKTWAVDLATHQAVWSYPLSGSLAISAKRVLYMAPYDAGSEDKIIAIKLQ